MESAAGDRRRLIRVTLAEDPNVRLSRSVEHERAVAVYDLLEENSFALIGDDRGPYVLHIGVEDNRLVLDIRDQDDAPLKTVRVPLTTLRSIIRDYFKICEAYFEAIRNASPSRIEAIDMARRGIHNEGAEILRERLARWIEMDDDTVRRLFTLVCVLQIRVWPE